MVTKKINDMKQLKDYLHLYLGCEVQFEFTTVVQRKELRNGKLLGIDMGGIVHEVLIHCHGYHKARLDSIKPILRPLDSMTEEEQIFICCMHLPNDWEIVRLLEQDEDDWAMRLKTKDEEADYKTLYVSKKKFTPELFNWLLKNHFDLFNLIPSGLAIEK